MCGIAGAWIRRSRRDPARAVRAMCDYMRLRGPDAGGLWADPEERLCLGHRRLTVIDLDQRSNQPLTSGDGEPVITFNGEIYNYQELRRQLLHQGARLRTTSDTEVILELYRRHGVAAFCMLRGMFALGIWDPANKALLLARDPYGIKPLYVAETPEGVLFASQVKALAASGHDLGAMDPAGAVGFMMWGSVPEPFTLFERVRPVPPGSFVVVTSRGVSDPTHFGELGLAWDAPPVHETSLEQTVQEVVLDSVRAHLVADVPVAVLLSGGVDSGVIAGLMADLEQDVEGITVTFSEFAGTAADEAVGARLLARSYGLRHFERQVSRHEFLQDTPAILAAMDQPSVDGVNTWFASKAVGERGYKVVLSGVGGDELFCGYDTFRNVPRIEGLGRALPRDGALRKATDLVFEEAARRFNRPKLKWLPRYASDFKGAYQLQRAVFMPEELRNVLDGDFVNDGFARLQQAETTLPASLRGQAAVAFLESTHYLRNQLLRDSDWASMAHSLEMRTPFADWTLLRRLAPYTQMLSGARGKSLLARAPKRGLPLEIVQRRKTGFGLPMQQWLRDSGTSAAASDAGVDQPWAKSWAVVVAQSFGVEILQPPRQGTWLRSVRTKAGAGASG